MEIPILSENGYTLKEIKLMYTKETKHEKSIHKKYLEENRWYFSGFEDVKDEGILMIYTKQKLTGHSVNMVDSRPLEKIKFR